LKIIKFGGKSLANGKGLERVIELIEAKSSQEEIGIVLSARGNTTDQLESLLERARDGVFDTQGLEEVLSYQLASSPNSDLRDSFEKLHKILKGVSILRDFSAKIKDEFLAQGELMSVKVVCDRLRSNGFEAQEIDTRELLLTDSDFGNAQPLEDLSSEKFKQNRENWEGAIPVFTGFIGANAQGQTTTLGRNGSNYSASLIANFLNASELESFTHVSGIYTANPDWVAQAQQIEYLSYQEANEMANFGTTVLHAKTIIPLIEKNIPLRILNTFDTDQKGTLISSSERQEGIKALSVLKDKALVNLKGRGLLGKIGVDARIFGTLAKAEISVSIISQGSSERGIGLVVDRSNAKLAKKVLEQEFSRDFLSKDIAKIQVDENIAVLSVIGQSLQNFHKPLAALANNQIEPLLINNTVTGKNICLVLNNSDLLKSVNVIHEQIVGIHKTVNLAIFGKGLVGGALINQLIKSKQQILEKKNISLNVFAVIDSKSALLSRNGINENWREELALSSPSLNRIERVINFANDHHLENLIAIDNTANSEFVLSYPQLVKGGFDLVSSNKIANTLDFDQYKGLREVLKKSNKKYLYETNVGAGLPLIDTLSMLHGSGEQITKIKGVFSGSLSYVFNTFSSSQQSFSSVLKDAVKKGYTEPDPRDDLSGVDVARKLLILARELDLENEIQDIEIQNLIPEEFREIPKEDFLGKLDGLDPYFEDLKSTQKSGSVLRYVAELGGDLSGSTGELNVRLTSVPESSSAGQLQGSDSLFEIYTESYGKNPFVIRGAGAGAEVTARGVFGDILRLSEQLS
jgi:aspartate kinase